MSKPDLPRKSSSEPRKSILKKSPEKAQEDIVALTRLSASHESHSDEEQEQQKAKKLNKKKRKAPQKDSPSSGEESSSHSECSRNIKIFSDF